MAHDALARHRQGGTTRDLWRHGPRGVIRQGLLRAPQELGERRKIEVDGPVSAVFDHLFQGAQLVCTVVRQSAPHCASWCRSRPTLALGLLREVTRNGNPSSLPGRPQRSDAPVPGVSSRIFRSVLPRDIGHGVHPLQTVEHFSLIGFDLFEPFVGRSIGIGLAPLLVLATP